MNNMQLSKDRFIAAVKQFTAMDYLSAPLLRELIDRIDVYNVTGTGKNRKQTVKIHWRFVGYLDLPNLCKHKNFKEETRKGVALEYSTRAMPA